MNIIVCIKQVPLASEAKIDPETKRIIRETASAILNPFDLYALEEGLLLKEKFGGEVIALSMGPEKAKASLREALSMGADRAVLLSDKSFGGSDTWATSYALSKAIQQLGGADLVICGKQAVDGDTAQVGPGIAAHLGWPQAAYVTKVESAGRDKIRLRRMNEEGWDICEVSVPFVMTVVKDINQPRVPTLKGSLRALDMEIPVLKPGDIGAELDKIGLFASPTRVVKAVPPEPRNTRTQVIMGQGTCGGAEGTGPAGGGGKSCA
jgi:electron transfer flavoprotein beta subunit